jgi:hypothetical protein
MDYFIRKWISKILVNPILLWFLVNVVKLELIVLNKIVRALRKDVIRNIAFVEVIVHQQQCQDVHATMLSKFKLVLTRVISQINVQKTHFALVNKKAVILNIVKIVHKWDVRIL